MTTARAIKKKGGFKLVYPDHYSCLITIKDLPRRSRHGKKEKKKNIWNLAKEGGWEAYEKVTREKANVLENILKEEEKSIEEKMEKFRKLHNKIKFRAFGKVRIKENKTAPKEGPDKKRESAEEMFNKQRSIAETEIERLKTEHRSKARRIWDIKRNIIGGKKTASQATAIVNPATKKLVVSKEEIKKTTLKYCKDTLQNNEAEEDFEEIVEDKREKVKVKLAEKDGQVIIGQETFRKVLEKFERSKKANYDMIVKANSKFQEGVFKFCLEMIEKEQFPEEFNETILHMIFKGGKGKKEVLSDNRFIHSKSWMPRLAEALLVEGGMKGPLVEKSSIYQIGGQSKHRPEELIFSMKSLVAKVRKEKRPVLLQCWDISKFFDKEMIEDALLTCYKRDVNPKIVRLWAKLNENTTIKVKTGVGESESANVGAVVGQGTIGGALVSQAVLDEGVKDHFEHGNEDEVNYGKVPMGPCMFQDDLIHAATEIEKARIASRKMNLVMKKHTLKLNKDKSVLIVMGSNKQKKDIIEELETNPIMCGEVKMNIKDADKWLGQQLSTGGLAESVAATVEKREAKIKGAALEIANIVNDWRSEAAGGMYTALLLWEACLIPSLLQGASTWVEVSAKTVRKLNSLQQWFLRLILQVGPGTPAAALGWETGVLDMKLRIYKEKLALISHIKNMDEKSLASQIYREQIENDWPGLAKEAKEICEDLGIEDVNISTMTKSEFKRLTMGAIEAKNESILRELAQEKTKCKNIMKEDYGRKKYVDENKIEDVRFRFKARVGLLPFAGNYSNDRRFIKTKWLCRCGEKEKEAHITSGNCPIYDDIWEKRGNLENNEDLVKFFSAVLERRDLLDRLEEEERDAPSLGSWDS